MEPVGIIGVGSYLPRTMHTNETLPPLDTPATDADLEKIGVWRRGWAGDGEGIAEMAASAAQAALKQAGRGPGELDFVIVANWTQRRFLPDFAPKVQALLGAPQAFAFDVATACAGFAYGVEMARSLLQNPRYQRGVVVASETTSQRGRPGSKATLVFGDAAGAWVIERGEAGHRILDVELGTDGTQYEAMEINEAGHVVTHIAQKDLQQLAIHSFRTATERVLSRNGMTLDDVDWIVPHSGTAGIQALLLRTLEVSEDRVLTNFREIGNVSSAAIPTAYDQFLREGRLKPGDVVLSPTTGSGWYSAAILVRL